MNTTTALTTLRRIYSATVCPALDPRNNANDIDTGSRADAQDAVMALLMAGEVAKARKVVSSFASIGCQLGAQHFCHLRNWKRLPGVSQRAALEMAGRTAPIAQDRFGCSVAATKFTFND